MPYTSSSFVIRFASDYRKLLQIYTYKRDHKRIMEKTDATVWAWSTIGKNEAQLLGREKIEKYDIFVVRRRKPYSQFIKKKVII